MASKVRWGVLGAAKIALTHVIPAMQQGERCEILALASRDGARARAEADKLGIARAYGSYEELLADPEIDAVYNPLPNHLHVPWSLTALEAGKHVLCEKPVALDAEQAQQLADASARTGRLVAEAFMVRHHPQWRRAREIIDGGRLGDVRAIQTIFSYFLSDPGNIRNQAEIGGGGLYDVGCYAINTARYVFAGEPERVTGLFDIDPEMKTDRMMSGLALFGGDRHLAFTCATQLVPCQSVQILGTRGRLEIAIPFNAPAGQATTLVLDDGRDLMGAGREEISISPSNQYTLQGDAFARAVLGEEQLLWGMTDAVANMRVLDAFFRSARSAAWEHP